MKKYGRTRSPGKLESMDVLVSRLFSDGKFGKSIQLAELESHWCEIAGKDLAAHSIPAKLTKDRLYVNVDSPLWNQQVDLMKEELLEKLAHRMQHIRISKIICKSAPPQFFPPV